MLLQQLLSMTSSWTTWLTRQYSTMPDILSIAVVSSDGPEAFFVFISCIALSTSYYFYWDNCSNLAAFIVTSTSLQIQNWYRYSNISCKFEFEYSLKQYSIQLLSLSNLLAISICKNISFYHFKFQTQSFCQVKLSWNWKFIPFISVSLIYLGFISLILLLNIDI